MNFPFSNFNASPSCKTPAPTNYSHILKPHELCSYYSNPHYQVENCLSYGQFFNFSYEQMNTSFSWQAHVMENFVPQDYELHHSDYLQFDNPSSNPSSSNYQSSLEDSLKEFMQLIGQSRSLVSRELSLEDALNVFRQTTNQCIQELKSSTMVHNQGIQELKDATMVNTQEIARLEGQVDILIAEFNIIEEKEFQSQEMARGQYMIDEDASSNSYHEHVQATTTPGNEETIEKIFCESSLEDPLEERFDQFRGDLDLDMLLEHAETSNEQVLKICWKRVLLSLEVT